MTREEAIQVLEEEAEYLYQDDRPYNREAFDMAIEALSEPSLKAIRKQIDEHWYLDKSDLINRADAIGAVLGLAQLNGRVPTDSVIFQIKALPSAEARWIPCSERLPERDELVLVTYKTTDKIHLCKYIDDGSENPWWSYIDDCCAWNNVVLAWMPLPEPYREDGE